MSNTSESSASDSPKPKVNPEGLDWRLPFIKHLAAYCNQLGLRPTDRDFHTRVLRIFYEQASVDDQRASAEQIGYARAAKKYQDIRAQTMIVGLVRQHWPATEAPLVQNRDAFQSIQTSSNSVSPVTVKRFFYDEPSKGVLSLTLNGEYLADGVRAAIESCLQARFSDTGLTIPEVKQVGPRQVDLLLVHRGYMSDFCEGLSDVAWIIATHSKPLSQYGEPISF